MVILVASKTVNKHSNNNNNYFHTLSMHFVVYRNQVFILKYLIFTYFFSVRITVYN